jgi:hypothetical protein
MDHVRAHANLAISNIADMLNTNSYPWYSVTFKATFENQLHSSGLEYVDLTSTTVGIDSITRVSIVKALDTTGNPISFAGNVIKKDISELTQLDTYHNSGWRHSVAWTHHGDDLVFFVGPSITTTNRATLLAPFYTSNMYRADYQIVGTDPYISIWAYRQPQLDNGLPPLAVGTGFTMFVDLPDKFMRLCLQMVQKMILEQLNQQVPAQLEQLIDQSIQQLNQKVGQEVQFEKSEREKTRYGNQQSRG